MLNKDEYTGKYREEDRGRETETAGGRQGSDHYIGSRGDKER